MGELAGRGAAGHTGFTGTSLVLDPATDTFVVLLANTVHPRRCPPDNRPRAQAATRVARAVRGARGGGGGRDLCAPRGLWGFFAPCGVLGRGAPAGRGGVGGRTPQRG